MIPLLLPGFAFADAQIDSAHWPDAFHHVTRVRRVKVGDSILIADGEGKRCTMKVDTIEKSRVLLTPEGGVEERPAPHVTLWMSVIDKSAMEEACHLVSQLGIATIHFVQSEYTNHTWNEKHTQRLQKIILASCTQSEQTWLPRLSTTPMQLTSLPWHEGQWHVAMERLATEKDSRALAHVDQLPEKVGQHVLIGPEGGWSTKEREYLTSLFAAYPKRVLSLDLGTSILRAETAALVACWSFTKQG